MKRELIFLRAFAFATVIGMVTVTTLAFREKGNQKFSEIDVERINIVEKRVAFFLLQLVPETIYHPVSQLT